MPKKKTHEDFVREVKELGGYEYEVLGKYQKSSIPVKLKHIKCGHVWFIRPNNFKTGYRCPNCYGAPKINAKKFKQKVFDLFGDEYTVLGEYINTKTEIKMRHNICGHEWYAIPNNLTSSKNKCPNCFKTPKKSIEEFENEIYSLTNGEYELITDYINTNTQVKIKHNYCGHIWSVIPYNFLRGSRCPKCFGGIKREKGQFEKEIYELVGSEYKVLGEYINGNTPIKIKHNKCGHIYEVRPGDFLSGKRCPLCYNLQNSKGEKAINKYLLDKKINFKRQYGFSDCVYDRLMRFDFAILDTINNLKTLIEYDGKQHYEPIEYFGGEEKFKDVQKRDRIKNEYCERNDIPLIRVPYWKLEDGTIESYLDEQLAELGLLGESEKYEKVA